MFKELLGLGAYMLLGMFFILLAKEYVADLVGGIVYKMTSHLEEDDVVYFKGREARLVKFGFIRTTFYMFDLNTKVSLFTCNLNGSVERKLLKRNN